jgi:hypothetical protein
MRRPADSPHRVAPPRIRPIKPMLDDAPLEFTVGSENWERLSEALIAANFWALDAVDECAPSLDGANWLIEGRRRDIYRAVNRWSRGGEVHALGQVFFALAGPPLSKVGLY